MGSPPFNLYLQFSWQHEIQRLTQGRSLKLAAFEHCAFDSKMFTNPRSKIGEPAEYVSVSRYQHRRSPRNRGVA